MMRDFKAEIARANAMRDDALLSMDRKKITAYFAAMGMGANIPKDPVFWIAVHKARTACTSLPLAARLESDAWLRERGYSSFYEAPEGKPS